MTKKTRSLREFRNPIGCLVLLAAFAAAAGCSTAESPGGAKTNMNHILPSGSSVSGWLVTPSGGDHTNSATLDYIAANGSSGCAQCHGSDLSGGISGVSCFGNPAGCHHGPVPNWTSPSAHGASAKKAPGSSGFASCQICHGNNFSGGGAQVPCSRCHIVNAPHPSRPWRSSTGSTHTNTNTANAPVCAQCHRNSNPGTPGCFNNTLCHGEGGIPHPVGNPAWVATSPAAQPHGNSAKATPSSTAGFAYCQVCHGTGSNFAGGSSGQSCYPCHSTTSNHPHPTQWRTGDTYVHTTTAAGNAAVCAYCHRNGANSPIPPPPAPAPGSPPDCFNNTLCHGAGGAPHPVGSTWVAASPAAQPHGNSAKATPGATAGYIYCQTCHGTGTDFAGGSSGISCYPCHVPTANSPHASQWRTGDTYVHTSTGTGNAAACAYCHLNGANSPVAPPSPPAPAGTAPGCFNSTLCHGAGGVPHPVGATWVATSPAAQPHGNSAKAAPTATSGFSYCQICHGTGTNFAGGSAISCYPCHGANAPHPNQWRTGDTYVHTTTATGNAAVCAFCHTAGANSPIAPPSPPAPAGTAPGCFNSTLCHGTVAAHPVPYNETSHYAVTSGTFSGSCGACHDVSAPSTKVGPVCQTCHVAASPLTAANCTSCHASPPNGGAGAAYANIAGAHAAHLVLDTPSNPNGTPVTCGTCHNGLEPSLQNLNHYNRAKSRVAPGDVAFVSPFPYTSETGGASAFSPTLFNCTNVSCHGNTAPNWRSSVIDPNTQCTICHASGTAQFNSYFSGEHNRHSGGSFTCTECHDMTLATTGAQNHFRFLSTPAMEGPAKDTFRNSTGTVVYTPGATSGNGTCTGTCHGKGHNSENW